MAILLDSEYETDNMKVKYRILAQDNSQIYFYL